MVDWDPSKEIKIEAQALNEHDGPGPSARVLMTFSGPCLLEFLNKDTDPAWNASFVAAIQRTLTQTQDPV